MVIFLASCSVTNYYYFQIESKFMFTIQSLRATDVERESSGSINRPLPFGPLQLKIESSFGSRTDLFDKKGDTKDIWV